jgi:large repetitive protein
MKNRNTQILPLALALAASFSAFGQATNASFVDAGPMIPAGGARVGHTATLLPNGKVLVAGGSSTGYSSNTLASATCYDPASYAWDPHVITGSSAWTLTGSMNAARSGHTATLLPNGKVLVVGGSGTNGPLVSAEIYDPATGTWTTTGSLQAARSGHTATLLLSGRVLVIGGIGANFLYGNPLTLSSAELYDPATGKWTSTGSLNTDRTDHTATLLPGGKVLVTGGIETATIYYKEAYWALASAELYDPASGTWTATGSMNTTRYLHRATLLPSGKVLVTGGQSGGFYFPPSYNSSTELYDPATGVWTNTGAMNAAHVQHTATLLPNGKLLVAGGWGYQYSSQIYTNAEIYDPTTATWAISASLNRPREAHTATLLPNGEVLLVGGYGSSGALYDAELYEPVIGAWITTGTLTNQSDYHTATLLPSGKVLVTGGFYYKSVYWTDAELYDPPSGTWTPTGAPG